MKLPITLAVMLSGLLLLGPARAEEGGGSEPAVANYEASAGIRYVSSRNRGNRGPVQEYDGRQYDFAEADLALGLWGDKGTFDFAANGINSAEENGYFDLTKGEHVRLSGDFDTLTHRTNFRNSGIRLNEMYRVNPVIGHYRDSIQAKDRENGAVAGDDTFFRRQTGEVRALFDLTTEVPTWIMAEYWGEHEEGTTTGRAPATNPGTTAQKADINRTTQDIALAAGAQGDGAGAVYEHVYREYDDVSVVLTTSAVKTAPVSSYVVRPRGARHKMNLDEVKFRFGTPDAALTATGQVGRRTRLNNDTGYRLDDYAGSMAAAYNPNPHFAVTGKLFARGTQVRENTEYRTILNTQGEVSQIDKNTLRAELNGRYAAGPAHIKAGYKFELNHRRDAPAEVFSSSAIYRNTIMFGQYSQANAVETEDTKHTVNLNAAVELPLGMELEAGASRMQANRPAYESMPVYRETYGGGLTAPMPFGLSASVGADQTYENNNKSNLTKSKAYYTNYMAALNWARETFDVGINAARSYTKAYSVGYWGTATSFCGPGRDCNYQYDPGLAYLSKDTTLGLNASARVKKKFKLTGNGSYTESQGAVPVEMAMPFRTSGVTNQVDATGNVTDLQPTKLQISRGAVRVEYAASRDLSVSAAYSVARWTNVLDSSQNGHVNILETGITTRF